MRAELASVFLAAERGVPHDPAQHAAYVGSWIKALREDKNEIFRAAHDASAATDYLLSLERERSIADEALAAGPPLDPPGSRAAILEEETQRLERDRDDEIEASQSLDSGQDRDRAPESAPRESSQYVARLEPGSGTVNVQEKQTGTDRRSTVETHGRSVANNSKERDAKDEELGLARAIAAKALGDAVRTVDALIDSGTYRGIIIGETDRYLIQRQSAGLAVLHQKELLDGAPQPGEAFSINYSNGKGIIHEARERSKSHGLSR